MTGKPLIRISIGSNDFTYTPETEAAGKFGFFGGKRYAYTITVKASGIEVTAAKGGTWNAGGSENVGVTITYDGTETEPKIGDYYYSDGTWRDGGLRKLYADGTMEWAETKPQPENGKNVIAIVFHAGHHENDASDYSATGIGQQKCHAMPLPCRMPQTVIVSGAFTEPSWVAAPRMEAEKNRTITLHLTSTGAATPGHRNHHRCRRQGQVECHRRFRLSCHLLCRCGLCAQSPVPCQQHRLVFALHRQMWNVYQNRASLFEGKTVVSGLSLTGTGPPRSSTTSGALRSLCACAQRPRGQQP